MNFNAEHGFTLIELLVSMVILSMIMMLLHGTLNFSAKTLGRNVAVTDRLEDVSQSQTFLREIIARSIPDRGSFQGTVTEARFLTTINKSGSSNRRYEVTLHERDGSLIMAWDAQKGEPEKGELILVEGLSDLTFKYGANDIYETGLWQTSWQAEEQPTYIKISLHNTAFWPEMVVERKLTHTIDCWFDPVSQGCRQR